MIVTMESELRLRIPSIGTSPKKVVILASRQDIDLPRLARNDSAQMAGSEGQFSRFSEKGKDLLIRSYHVE